jgi:hypothetical protein
MNEQEIGARFRALDNGSEPDAPVQLRRFVRDRAFVEAAPLGAAAGRFAHPRPFGRAIVGIAAALVIGIAATGMWLSLRGPSADLGPTASATATPSATPTSTPSPSASPSPSPTPTVSLYWHSYSWDATGAQPPLPYFGLPAQGGGYFGGCYMGLAHVDWPYIGYPFCTSADGLHWSVSTDPMFKGIDVASVAKGSGGYVMVGGVMATGRAVIFRSSDGAHWTRVPDANVAQKDLTLTYDDGSSEHGLTPMGAVVSGPNGYVAVGWHDLWQQAPHPPAVLWHSKDGVKWTAVSSPGEGYSYLYSLGNRYFLSATGPEDTGFLLWYSDDGVTWKRATADSDPAFIYVHEMSVAGDGSLVADVWAGALGEVSYSSTDGGTSWHYEGPVVGCQVGDVTIQDTSYSIDGGTTWQTVEESGPPSFPGCWALSLGDGEFGYSIGETRSLAWFGKP